MAFLGNVTQREQFDVTRRFFRRGGGGRRRSIYASGWSHGSHLVYIQIPQQEFIDVFLVILIIFSNNFAKKLTMYKRTRVSTATGINGLLKPGRLSENSSTTKFMVQKIRTWKRARNS